ncbi:MULTISPECIES: hypothetical protein [unclassified Halomonas]|uniref:hypothetical protein n=1 Tax=unclassified Halomonas TaxID=2609666 RepID=UPI0007D94DA0|nr:MULTISPECIES: hypothetical protein [unclassified Halomonas]MBT2784830.1 hypothetical protein [Halomonas sp. ISL-106]MBT2796524.1 hypothetical protein [Halomonas sp. ISL-104]OAL59768.1 hypothetical protein A6R74_00380 [Halomonas sp. ALS9]
MPKLPAELDQLLSCIEIEKEQYPDRQSDLESLQDYVANGNTFMVRSTAERIVEQQRAIKQMREQGLPADLQLLCERIEQEEEQYPDRQSDLESLQDYVANGNTFMVRSTAERIVEQQRAIKQMREQGLPADLQLLCERIEQEEEQYPDRQSDLESLQEYIVNGNTFMVRSTAERIIDQQRARKQMREQGLPSDLQLLCERIEQEEEQYPDRQSDLESLQEYIVNGNTFMVRSTAERVIEQQRSVKQIREHGLPADLQLLCERIEQEEELYPDRQSELESLQDYIVNGNIFMAKSTAERVVEQQRAVRQMRK